MNVLVLGGTLFLGLAADVTRACAAGLQLRPVLETVRATRDWYAGTGRPHLLCGLDPQHETELLDTWNAAISF